jgi:hypothetical protein
MGRSNADGYAAAVVAVLASEFPAVAEEDTAGLVRNAVAAHRTSPVDSFEFIVDSPTLSNWRLKPHRSVVGRVRLACYRMEPTPADNEREHRINTALDEVAD